MSWESRKFSELYLIPSRNGLTRPSAVRGSGFMMVGMGELFANTRIGSNIPMERVQLNDRELEQYTLRPDDLLFARQSLVLEGAGKCSIVTEVTEPTAFESHLIRIRLDKSISLPSFYYYLFSSALSGMSSIVQQCAQAGIRGSDLAELPVMCPPLYTQHRIASILSAYDDLIENNRRRMALLEESARLLYREWFVHLRFPGHASTRLNDGVPEGWERKALGVLAEITMGQSPESKFYNEAEEGLPFHQGVADFGSRFVSHRVFTTALNRFAEPGDILCSVRAPVGRLNLTLDKIVIGRGLAAIRSRTNHQSLLFYQLRSYFFKEDLIGSGTIFASVTKAEFLRQEILVPTKKIADEFEDITRSLDEQLRVLHHQNRKLRAARDLLLPRLMNGEIEL